MTNLTDTAGVAATATPFEMPVSELLTGNYIFSIPSYQRGYRWESSEPGESDDDKQVDDLLNDLTSFVLSNDKGNYYLQPLMVKPEPTQPGKWIVLDGQQRLTTMLLTLKCLNEKLNTTSPLPLYSLAYENLRQLDFDKITYSPANPNYNFPLPNTNPDSYYVRKAKDRIERWYNQAIAGNQPLQDKLKELLFYPDATRGTNSNPKLRAKFIWYNVDTASAPTSCRLADIEVFNRLNRGKISLTDSELIKALFMIRLKDMPSSSSSLMSAESLVRKWDEMGKKFQDNEFWKMISPKNKEYSNRMDLLFDFIKDCNESESTSAYRYYYNRIHHLQPTQTDALALENLWSEIKRFFDTLCKWHEDTNTHNFIGYLVENDRKLSHIFKSLQCGNSLKEQVRKCLGFSDINVIDDFSYSESTGYQNIKKTLLLFNVLTCDKFGQKFPFNLYRDNSYDVEHVNSQTDNPIEKIEEKTEWIIQHAIPCLWIDRLETDNAGHFSLPAREARDLIIEGIKLLKHFKDTGRDTKEKFKPYRTKVENYYACGSSSVGMPNKDSIGNLTLLNSSINREYKNALFPKKLRTIKRSDQEGAYIPLCTKYMFLKYYSNSQANASAFSMMRWREADQTDYVAAIKDLISTIF